MLWFARTACVDFAVMPAVQHRLVSWRPSLHRRMIRYPLPRTIRSRQSSSEKLAADADATDRVIGDKAAASPPPDDDDEDDDDELEIDDDEDDEDLVVFTAKEAAGALATIYAFVKPFLKNYKKILTFVGLGVLVETLFNVIMPLSLKFLIDDALGEEDFEALDQDSRRCWRRPASSPRSSRSGTSGGTPSWRHR